MTAVRAIAIRQPRNESPLRADGVCVVIPYACNIVLLTAMLASLEAA